MEITATPCMHFEKSSPAKPDHVPVVVITTALLWAREVLITQGGLNWVHSLASKGMPVVTLIQYLQLLIIEYT